LCNSYRRFADTEKPEHISHPFGRGGAAVLYIVTAVSLVLGLLASTRISAKTAEDPLLPASETKQKEITRWSRLKFTIKIEQAEKLQTRKGNGEKLTADEETKIANLPKFRAELLRSGQTLEAYE